MKVKDLDLARQEIHLALEQQAKATPKTIQWEIAVSLFVIGFLPTIQLLSMIEGKDGASPAMRWVEMLILLPATACLGAYFFRINLRSLGSGLIASAILLASIIFFR